MRGWIDYMETMGATYECLVREFYGNVEIIEPRKFETFVREIKFQVTMATIFDQLKPIKRELGAQFPLNPPLEMSTSGIELTGDPTYVWGRYVNFIK